MRRTEIKQLLTEEKVGSEVVVKGWVKAFRSNRFIQLNDGSTIKNIQAVVDFAVLANEKNAREVLPV